MGVYRYKKYITEKKNDIFSKMNLLERGFKKNVLSAHHMRGMFRTLSDLNEREVIFVDRDWE